MVKMNQIINLLMLIIYVINIVKQVCTVAYTKEMGIPHYAAGFPTLAEGPEV